jgi:ribonuclease E
MKRMLINATQKEELRVAIVDGQKLIDLDIEGADNQQKKSNIYKGKITRVEPSLDAAFVEYGAERHGFLPLKEIWSGYIDTKDGSGDRVNMKQALKEGTEVLVQIDKDERGSKGAALTTFISLAGRFMVLMPNNPRGGGVSRRIAGDERDEIRAKLKEIDVPDGMSVIVRTAGIGRTAEELNWDLDYLKGVWNAIIQVIDTKPAPFLIFQDNSPVIRALRDHLNSDIGEIIVDNNTALTEARQFMEHAMPHNIRKLQLYAEPVPLFTRFQIESQIESAFSHSVSLPSGGSLVIDPTEALVSIDINSARATKGDDIEATAFQTNLEAADEIARQCRLRDLGGLLVIDFIDMGPSRNQREVENRLRDAIRSDRARVQIGKISRFGLLEMSRQRMRRSLGESAHQVCPRCSGAGTVRSVESLALSILRLVGEESRKDMTAKVITELPIDVATYLLNEKRDWIMDIEKRDKVQLLLVANANLETPHYTIRRVRNDQIEETENTGVSYSLTTPEENLTEAVMETSEKRVHEAPAISVVRPATPAPAPQTKPEEVQPKLGLFGWIKQLFFGDGTAQPKKQPRAKPSQDDGERGRGKGRNRKTGSTEGRTGNRRSDAKGRDGKDSKDKKADKQRDGRKSKQQNRKAADKQAEGTEVAQDRSAEATQNGNQPGAKEGGENNRKKRSRRRRSRTSNRDKSAEGNEQNDAQDAGQNNNQNASQASGQSNDQSTDQNSNRNSGRSNGHNNGKDKAAESQPATVANSAGQSQPQNPAPQATPPATAAPAQSGPVNNPVTPQSAPTPAAKPPAASSSPAQAPPVATPPAPASPSTVSAPQAVAAKAEATSPPAAPKSPAVTAPPAAPAAVKPAAPLAAPTTPPAPAPAAASPVTPPRAPETPKAASQQPAAASAPAKPAPAQPVAQAPANTPATAGNDRRLAWETAVPDAAKSQKVWSSDGDKPKGSEEH